MKRHCLPLLAVTLLAQDATFKVDTKLVLVSVSAKDKNGSPITDLVKADFEILEDNVPQTISVFELQRPGSGPLMHAPSGRNDFDMTPSSPASMESSRERDRFQNRRLIALFFDLASMKPPERARALQAATAFIQRRMSSSSLISIIGFNSKVNVIEDFTDDRQALVEDLRRMSSNADSAAATVRSKAGGGDSGLFFSDDTEFSIFNTDRRLAALESAARTLGIYPGKKALIYFSSGIEKTGAENLSQFKATVNTAKRANVSFYPIDARGLVAMPPGGDASMPSQSGSGILTGAQQQGLRDSLNASQETLYTLAADTAGRAFLDSNDLTLGLRRAEEDIDSYYTIGYYSTNSAEDGKYRRLRILLKNSLQAKLEYHNGYYAAKTFEKLTSADKERQLKIALALGSPVNDMPLALEVDFFRVAKNRYFVPISLKIPASSVTPIRDGGRQTADFDFLGEVRDSDGKLVGGVRDSITVALAGLSAPQTDRRYLAYDAGLTMPSGLYHLSFVARENRTGKMGTFETKFTIPNLSSVESLRISSVVLSGQSEPVSSAVGAVNDDGLQAMHPLVREGRKLVPSIARVFRPDQTLYVYCEVYDPGLSPEGKGPSLAAELDLLQGPLKVFTSEPLLLTKLETARSGVVPVGFQVPLAGLPVGDYTAQLTVIDELGRKFAFLRKSIHLLP